jgi:hypothetical protein
MIEMASRTTVLVNAMPLDQHRKEVPPATAPAKRDRDPLSRFIAQRVTESVTSDGPHRTFLRLFQRPVWDFLSHPSGGKAPHRVPRRDHGRH